MIRACCLAALVSTAIPAAEWSSTIEALGQGAARADAGGYGDLAVDESMLAAYAFWNPHRAVYTGLGVEGALHRYDGDDLDMRGRAAWLRLPLTVMWSEHWGVTTRSSLGTATDGDASAADGRSWQLQGGLLYVRDEDLLIALTAVGNSQFGRRATVFPLVSGYWKIDDAWSLTVVDQVDSISRLTWRMAPTWSAGLLLDVRFFQFALEQDGGGAASLSDDRVIVGLEGAWHPFADDRLAVRPFVGAAVARWITVRDEDGGELSSERVRPAPAAGLSLRAEF